MLQENDRKVINKKVIFDFLEDAADIGVKGISLYQMEKIQYLLFLLMPLEKVQN